MTKFQVHVDGRIGGPLSESSAEAVAKAYRACGADPIVLPALEAPLGDDYCVNCGLDMEDHTREDLKTCQREHDEALQDLLA